MQISARVDIDQIILAKIKIDKKLSSYPKVLESIYRIKSCTFKDLKWLIFKLALAPAFRKFRNLRKAGM
jgi:hypothetical protein